MKFIPYRDKIEIIPQKKVGIIKSQKTDDFVEYGEVVSVGENVTFVKAGDKVFFDSWGCMKTPKIDGVERYLVTESGSVILGKYVE